MVSFAERSRFYKEMTERELDRLLPPRRLSMGRL